MWIYIYYIENPQKGYVQKFDFLLILASYSYIYILC